MHVTPHTTAEQHAFADARYMQALPGAAKPLKIGMQMSHRLDPRSPTTFTAAFVYHDGSAETYDDKGWHQFPNREAFMKVYTGHVVSKCHYFDRAGNKVKKLVD